METSPEFSFNQKKPNLPFTLKNFIECSFGYPRVIALEPLRDITCKTNLLLCREHATFTITLKLVVFYAVVNYLSLSLTN